MKSRTARRGSQGVTGGKHMAPVGKAIWGAKVVEDLIARSLANSPWIGDRYSTPKMRACLGKWWRALRGWGEEEGMALTDEEIFRHFRISYLRTLSSRRRREELECRISLVIDRIKKDRLLLKIGINPNARDPKAQAWRQRALGVIEERLGLWERSLRGAIPGLFEEDVYRYFRQRYLHVPLKRFREVEIAKGIKNTRNHIVRRVTLEELGIDKNHPQHPRWNRMEFWEFKRKKGKLYGAIEACERFSLKFPPKSGVNTRQYIKHLNAYPRNMRPTKAEAMLYKLILYFEGMTVGQLQRIRERHLPSHDWQKLDLDTSLNHLVNLKLVGVEKSGAGLEDRYYIGRAEYLRGKIEACRAGSLDFARDVDQAEVEEYLRWIREHGDGGIGIPERLLLKLISHYGLVSQGELNMLYTTYLSRNGGRSTWSKLTPRTYLTKLVDFELVEVVGKNGRVVKDLNLTKVPDDLCYRIHRGFLLI